MASHKSKQYNFEMNKKALKYSFVGIALKVPLFHF